MKIIVQVSIIIFLSISFISCTKPKGPEGVLREFVTIRMKNENVGKEDTLKMLTGELLLQYQDMDEDTFNSFMANPKYKQKDFSIDSTKCANEKCFITYTLTYMTVDDTEKEFTTDVKKIAEILKEGDLWKIAAVDTVKTYHESHAPLQAK